MKKGIALIISLAVMTLALVGCSTKSTESTTELAPAESTVSAGSTSADDGTIKSTGPNGETAVNANELKLTDEEIEKVKAGKYKAAISFHYGGNDWSASQLKGLQDTFAKLGIEIVGTTDANFSAERQVTDLETLTALKPNVLIGLPTDATATADAFKRVSNAGVKLVFMDNIPKDFKAGKEYVSCVSADNYGNGVVAADIIGQALKGKGSIGTVFYDVDYFVTNQRLEAFEKTMKEKYPDIKIISKMGFTNVNQASTVADAMLTQNPKLDAVFAHWDVVAEGVLSSVKAAGRNEVKVSTIDLGNNIAKEIAQGTVLGLGAQLPYDQGVAEATLAAYSLLGKEAPPYVAVPAKHVDKNNILEAYKDVYHVDAPDWLVEAVNKNK
ncbi:substrate-binding domain-containing protein [Clostridium magnum]|uniref:D-ribose-binding periplasmic protein n=1 Tax=Clostridium magnum DSM 2767 TaxID=1121326 RepID=A0A162QH70_9CLOT|nr:substrate-binding domain-containing protein [Clostridium magnum]KZL88523.1 D-ribose-binding periplasmic protein precursor [Clostridium magnum DSM 2767]SHI14765.1 ribose transport system substrate-binding protein [Clostridium magnum DSM 2767]